MIPLASTSLVDNLPLLQYLGPDLRSLGFLSTWSVTFLTCDFILVHHHTDHPTTGFVSGVLLFFFLGVIAFYTGMQLWYMYLHLDSDEYPVHNYSDLTERIYGRVARHGVNILQTLQLLFNVAVIICKYIKYSVCTVGTLILFSCSGVKFIPKFKRSVNRFSLSHQKYPRSGSGCQIQGMNSDWLQFPSGLYIHRSVSLCWRSFGL